LRWSDIDFAAPSVRIERALAAARGAGVYVKTTKTGGVRHVSITALARDVLAARLEQAQLSAAANGTPQPLPSDFIFSTARSGALPMRPEFLTRRWHRLRATANSPAVRLHELRHCVATELLTAGFDVRTVANRLGHARTSTTMDIYWAFVPARDRDAADHLDAILTAGPAELAGSTVRPRGLAP
jgi:integrase